MAYMRARKPERPTYKTIINQVVSLNLGYGLKYLNHVLSVSRGFTNNPATRQAIASHPNFPVACAIRFAAKQMLLNCSPFAVAQMSFGRLESIFNAMINMYDPIEGLPTTERMSALAAIERIAQQQFPPQIRVPLQKFGLYLELFRDSEPVEGFDLKAETEAYLGMSITEFASVGYACLAGRAVSSGYGSFTRNYFKDHTAELPACTSSNIDRFLQLASATPKGFVEAQIEFAKRADALPQYEFNLLQQKPVTELEPDRFIAVDPELCIDRVTEGLFYDLFDKQLTDFSERFGKVFEAFAGKHLARFLGAENLLADEQLKKLLKKKQNKVCDWLYFKGTDTVLFETKSLRPKIQLMTVTDGASVNEITERICEAIRQMSKYDEFIRSNHPTWEGKEICEAKAYVLVMFGQLFTVNNPLWRDHIKDRLKELNITYKPFVVLCPLELDFVMRLVEDGYDFTSQILKFAEGEEYLHGKDHESRISTYTWNKGKEFIDQVLKRIS